MKRFQFNLEALVNVRHMHEEQAQMHFSRSIQLLNAAKSQLETLLNLTDITRKEWQQVLGEKKTIDDFTLYSSYIKKLTMQSEQQQLEVIKAEKFHQECLIAYQEARKKRKIVERLKEKKRQQYFHDVLAEEQKFLDEIATQRYHRKM